MKRILSLFIILAAMLSASGAELKFTGATLPVITVNPAANTGLNAIYVVNATGGVGATYTASSPSVQVTWYRYSTLGGGYAEEVAGIIHDGSQWTLPQIEGDMGYIIEEGTDRYYCWIVDYGIHRFSIDDLTPGPEQDCDMATLLTQGHGDRIVYYTINGRPEELSREIMLTYNTLQWDADNSQYRQVEKTVTFPYLTGALHAPAPMCDTRFTLTGDRFLKSWGQDVTIESDSYQAIAVEAQTKATQAQHNHDNEQSAGGDGMLGGSAPAEITFSAEVTDAVVYKEWQFSSTPDFYVIDMRVNELEVTQTFTERGTCYVRFLAANAQGTCDYTGTTYEIFIGESALTCPNAFSPGASEGVNDEWKVSYKSIIEFDCHIFNRWGTQMCSFTDPSKGWDGKYNGKIVPSGVYYYVIKARGADGREYKLSGDINVINYR